MNTLTSKYNFAFVAIFLTVLAGLTLQYYFGNYLFLFPLLAFSIFLLGFVCVTDFKKVYYLLLFLIPISIETELPGGLALDFPAEPFIILLMVVFFLYAFSRGVNIKKAFFAHAIIMVVVIHLIWTFISSVYAGEHLIALKFFVAKLWYIAVFVFLTGSVLIDVHQFKKALWLLVLPVVVYTCIILARHAAEGFEFDTVNAAVIPYFRNHVNYAAVLSLLFPFVWIAASWYPKGDIKRKFFIALRYFFLIAIFFSYTRGAWLALLMAALFYYILKHRLYKPVLVIGCIIGLFIGGTLFTNNKFMEFTPDFERTIYHSELTKHLTATTNLQDVSSAERVYRWVAGFRMAADNPIIGFGPGNFYSHYKKYTLSSFSTYVSENPEKSSVHNYFLLMLVEQGVVGLIIFVLLTVLIFYKGIELFYKVKDPARKKFVTAILLSLLIIYVQLMLSDLVEALKIGSLFFINIALLVNQDIIFRKEQSIAKFEGKADKAHDL